MNTSVDKEQSLATIKSNYNKIEKRMYIIGAITLVLAIIFLAAVPFISIKGQKLTFGEVSDMAKLANLKSSVTNALTMHTILWIVVIAAAVLMGLSYVKRNEGSLWLKIHLGAAAGTAVCSLIMWILHMLAATDVSKKGTGVAYLWAILVILALCWAMQAYMMLLLSKAMDKISETAE